MTTPRPWWHSASFYHIYPLGYCGAPPVNDGISEPVPRIHTITEQLDPIASLGFSALYLGPVFESHQHGYDTIDYFKVDRRLGTNADLADLVRAAHDRGIHVVLDGVFNHVGRGFWAFADLRAQGRDSEYQKWFKDINFEGNNRFGDGFTYKGWEGVEDLVSLNHAHAPVRDHLFAAVEHMIQTYDIDGLRLDVAYLLPGIFLDKLSRQARSHKNPFWLMGEIIHGNYAAMMKEGRLDSVTNYECYKGLWSSFKDRNLFEIGHSLHRLFGEGGILTPHLATGKLPYNFADNHDVDRVAESLQKDEHLFPLYALLWTIPGIPSVYYGSEYGIWGSKATGDLGLRPAWSRVEHRIPDLREFIGKLNQVRCRSQALRTGGYRQIAIESAMLVFERYLANERVLVGINADPHPVEITLPSEMTGSYRCLFSEESLYLDPGSKLMIPAYGCRVIQLWNSIGVSQSA